MKGYFSAMRQYFWLSGRATRSEYWYFQLFFSILAALAAVGDAYGGWGFENADGDPGPLFSIVVLVHVLPLVAVTIRRLHDIDRTGWWVLLYAVPLLALILPLTFGTQPSTPGLNRFDPPTTPLGKNVSEAAQVGTAVQWINKGVDLEKLERLASLRASGVIDEQEFQTLKAGIIGGAT